MVANQARRRNVESLEHFKTFARDTQLELSWWPAMEI
jgi:hypothetical protein